jgi:uncharacterized protein (TIRG00374 family)
VTGAEHPSRRRWTLLGKAALVVGVAAGGLWTATHGVAGVSWGSVLGVLGGVTAWQLGLLALIWLGGLGIYSLVLSAALPGLGVRRSLLLNLSGSAVANVVPLGGAVATAMNWRMARTWGHTDGAFAAYCLLTNVLDVLTKLVLPMVAVATLVALSMHVPPVLWAMTAGCAVVILVALLVRAVLSRRRSGAEPDAGWLRSLRALVQESGGRMREVLSDHWQRLLSASIGYVAAQVVLLYVSLHAVGLAAPVGIVLTAAAIERLGTLVPLTPGGTGVAEVGTIAWLVAAGLNPVAVVAGVLLYRVFLIVMEIPLGGALLAAWVWGQRTSGGRRRFRVVA